jgi:hypothetical protein
MKPSEIQIEEVEKLHFVFCQYRSHGGFGWWFRGEGSWLVRIGLIKSLKSVLLKLSFLIGWLGSANCGFHVGLTGKDENGRCESPHWSYQPGRILGRT